MWILNELEEKCACHLRIYIFTKGVLLNVLQALLNKVKTSKVKDLNGSMAQL